MIKTQGRKALFVFWRETVKEPGSEAHRLIGSKEAPTPPRLHVVGWVVVFYEPMSL